VPSLDVEESEEGGVRLLGLSGELDVETEPALRRPLLEAVSASDQVVLDLNGLTFMDSHGMRLMLTAVRESGRRAGRFVIACSNPTILRLFTLTGMDRTLEIAPDREAALSDLA
jgi:anti-sigma B factor antagonist